MTPDVAEGAVAGTVLTPWLTSGPPSATRAGRAKPSRSRSLPTSFLPGRFRLDGCTFTKGDARGSSLPRLGSLVRVLALRRRDASSSNVAPNSDARRWAGRASSHLNCPARRRGTGQLRDASPADAWQRSRRTLGVRRRCVGVRGTPGTVASPPETVENATAGGWRDRGERAAPGSGRRPRPAARRAPTAP